MNIRSILVTFSFFCQFYYTNGFWMNNNMSEIIRKENEYILSMKNLIDTVNIKCAHLKPSIPSTAVSPERTSMMLFANGTMLPFPLSNAAEEIYKHPNFNINATTIIFCHGFQETGKDDYILHLGSKIIPQGYNFLSFDTSHYLMDLNYIYVANLAKFLGDILYEFINKIQAKGVATSNIHLIGFSLGAQIAGFAARKFKNVHGKLLPRISALDPSSVCFSNPGIEGLGPKDAQQVDAIFSSVLSYTPGVVGRTQYFANGRYQNQPGCPSIPIVDIYCSHVRVVDLFLESVENRWAFVSKRCKDVNVYDCQFFEWSQMGFASSANDAGDYHLTTDSKYPFNKGIFGLF